MTTRAAPLRRQGRGTSFAAQDDDAQGRHVLGQQCQQGRHRVEHGDAGILHAHGQDFGILEHVLRRDPQSRAGQIRQEDLFQRQVESDRGALEHHVLGRNLEQSLRRREVVADVAVADHYALGQAGRARGIDQIGRVFGLHRFGQHRQRAVSTRQFSRRQHLLDDSAGLRPGRVIDHQGDRLGIVETDRDAFGRCCLVEGQIGGARAQDGQQRHLQIERASHPQADEITRLDARGHQAARHRLYPPAHLAISQRPAFEDRRDTVGRCLGAREEQVGKQACGRLRSGGTRLGGERQIDLVHDIRGCKKRPGNSFIATARSYNRTPSKRRVNLGFGCLARP